MAIFSKSIYRLTMLLALLGVFFLMLPPDRAQALEAAPFEGMAGSWNGSGAIRLASGVTERLRCRAAYSVGSSGHTLIQNLRCSSDSYNFDLRVNLASNGGVVSGNWAEMTHNVTGEVSGRNAKGVIQVNVSGPSFSAAVAVATHGAQQSVSIRAQGGDLKEVTMSLRRGG